MCTHIDDNAHLSGRSEHINKFPPPRNPNLKDVQKLLCRKTRLIANNIIPGIIIKYQPLMGPELQQGVCKAKLLQTPDSKILYSISQLYLYF